MLLLFVVVVIVYPDRELDDARIHACMHVLCMYVNQPDH